MSGHHGIYISATRKSSGKTTLATGLTAAISARGIKVQTFKKGPDYIDPMWMATASDRPCYNLDFYTQSHAEISSLFFEKSASAEFSLIEGNKGLFDGVDLLGTDSNAALSTLLDVPVVLVIDAAGITRGVAPLVNGYTSFESEIIIAGVILNNVAGSRHESKLRNVLEHYTDMEVWGVVQKNSGLIIEERHLGLTPGVELERCEHRIDSMRNVIEQQVDIDKVLASKYRFPTKRNRHSDMKNCTRIGSGAKRSNNLQIGVAKDAAFSFYYADDLEALQTSGADIAYFDTLMDAQLPDVDALFIGGGFPETNAKALSENKAMHEAIRQFVKSGKPIYAECGGLMYLSRSIRWGDQHYPMVGCLPADTEMESRPVGRGYVRIAPTEHHPWFSQGADSDSFKPEGFAAHEFHYSHLININPEVRFAYKVERGYGVDGEHDGLIYGNIFASYAHLRHTRETPWVHWFLACIDHSFSRAA